MNSKKQLGREGELRFAAEFSRKGWNIFLPFGEDGAVDLLVEKEGEYKRIQIKSTKCNNEVIMCRLKSSNNWQVKKYTSEEIDFFGIYDSTNKKGYLINVKEVEGKIGINLRINKAKNNQTKNTRLAKEYEFF